MSIEPSFFSVYTRAGALLFRAYGAEFEKLAERAINIPSLRDAD